MKLICSKNYYQQKKWEMAMVDRGVAMEYAGMSEEEKMERERKHEERLEMLKKETEKILQTKRYVPSLLLAWSFRRLSIMALRAAKYFQMNLTILVDKNYGHINLYTDEIFSETIWHDGHYRHYLLTLLKWADGISISIEDDHGTQLIRISLNYKLMREVSTKPQEGAKVAKVGDSAAE